MRGRQLTLTSLPCFPLSYRPPKQSLRGKPSSRPFSLFRLHIWRLEKRQEWTADLRICYVSDFDRLLLSTLYVLTRQCLSKRGRARGREIARSGQADHLMWYQYLPDNTDVQPVSSSLYAHPQVKRIPTDSTSTRFVTTSVENRSVNT